MGTWCTDINLDLTLFKEVFRSEKNDKKTYVKGSVECTGQQSIAVTYTLRGHLVPKMKVKSTV